MIEILAVDGVPISELIEKECSLTDMCDKLDAEDDKCLTYKAYKQGKLDGWKEGFKEGLREGMRK
jgi:flagellar biosynthesis/type III secretory pathway protein FliH